jgi:hypothetical protein
VLHSSNLRVWQHPAKKISFLVGLHGKSEVVGIGGAWDPADGDPPARNPSSLIRTAVRTFKAATGVDLSPCCDW